MKNIKNKNKATGEYNMSDDLGHLMTFSVTSNGILK